MSPNPAVPPSSLPLHIVASLSEAVAATSKRSQKTRLLADLLRRTTDAEVPVVVRYLSGVIPQGRIGIGPSTLGDADTAPASDATLHVAQVQKTLSAIAGTTGKGSRERRVMLLRDLMSRATASEQRFLRRLITGELRQGALEGLMADAVAKAFDVPARAVRRANMLVGDPAKVAEDVIRDGPLALGGYGVEVFRPLQPMLASTAETVEDAVDRLGRASFEWKLDGARVQVHRRGREVRVYTRKLNDVTHAVPEVVEAALDLSASEFVLDGETIALREDGAPLPFQATMRRFGRKLDVAKLQRQLPLSVFFFDVLAVDGETLLDAPYSQRAALLEPLVPEANRIPRLTTADVALASGFLRTARAKGHEGIMAKALDAPYEAGRRGKGWLKLKPVHTLDLVVLAAEWGHGRRQGWLSNLHLGARDPARGGFVMLGKTFKGMTDEILEWQTAALQELATHRERHVVHVRPELVVEIAFNDVQASPRYPSGMALRHARVKGYRPDKSASEADTVETVRAIHLAQGGGAGTA